MIGPDNWVMVRCASSGCTSPEWLMHWPCEGSEEEIRNGKHYCDGCILEQSQQNSDQSRSPVRHLDTVQIKAGKTGNRTYVKSKIGE